jgi:hypothetical protein
LNNTKRNAYFFSAKQNAGGLRKLYAVVASETAGAVAFIRPAGAGSVILPAGMMDIS